MGKKISHTSFVAFVLGLSLTIATFAVLLLAGLLIQDLNYKDKFYPGVTLDGVSLRRMSLPEAMRRYNAKNDDLKKLALEIKYEGDSYATIGGDILQIKNNAPQVAAQAYLVARQGTALNRLKEKVQSLLYTRSFAFKSTIFYNKQGVSDILDLIDKQYSKEPKEALFKIQNGKVISFAKDENGIEVQVTPALLDLESQVRTIAAPNNYRTPPQLTLKVTSKVVAPQVTLRNANTQGIEEVIGVGESDYSHSIPNRIHNLLLASDRINGALIPKGAIFSYNATIGEISGNTGYLPAYVIVNGRTELGDGGGVCQTSTTLFRAAINTGLPITEWTPHAYRVGYYENDGKPGRDATVFSPSVDLKFKNDTQAAILIVVEKDLDNKKLKYIMYGKKDKRQVTISDVSMGQQIPAPPAKYQDDPTIKKGVTRQIDFAAAGLKAWFEYNVKLDGKTTFSRTFVSNYRPWQAVYLVGTAE